MTMEYGITSYSVRRREAGGHEVAIVWQRLRKDDGEHETVLELMPDGPLYDQLVLPAGPQGALYAAVAEAAKP